MYVFPGSNHWGCSLGPHDKCSGGEPYKGPVYNGPIIESLEEILNPVVRILYYGGLFVGIFFIILSGYKLMTSEGDPQRTKEGSGAINFCYYWNNIYPIVYDYYQDYNKRDNWYLVFC